ncbi:MAG: DUF362 domain-containing protein [Saprospiraceae bacterium]|nr:DUF362 domain-containing protein [Saprospiraceae bacterium]
MKRRGFLRNASQTAMAMSLPWQTSHFLFNQSMGSPLVSIFDDKATSLFTSKGKVPNNDRVIVDLINSFSVNRVRVSNMMDAAVKQLTGKSELGKAWESLFPAGKLNENTTVSIKINLSYGEPVEENNWNEVSCPFGPKVALSDAIVHGLSQMLDGNFPVENITIFDTLYSGGSRRFFPLVQGYRPVQVDEKDLYIDRPKGAYGIHWVNPRNKLEIPEDAPEFTAAPGYPKEYRAHQKVKRPVFENDYMINIAIAKDHREAGVTGVMKNNYGCTNNPMGTHGSTWRRLDSPYPGTRLCVPVFYKSLDEITPCILNVMDALVGVYHGGPLAGKVFHTNSLTISKDPLAIDTYLLNLVNEFRQKNGYAAIETKDGKNEDGHLNASFLRISEERHEIGSAAQNNLSRHNLSQQEEKYHIPIMDMPQSRVGDVMQTKGHYQLPVFMDESNRLHNIQSWIEDTEGNMLKKLKSQSTTASYAEVVWKPRISKKKREANPRFVWNMEVDGARYTRIVHM